MDDAGARFVVFLLGDPHLLEGGEGSQDGASDPDGVLSLGRSDDLDLHGGRSQGGDLLLHTIGDTGVHGGATGKDRVGVKILKDGCTKVRFNELRRNRCVMSIIERTRLCKPLF